MRSSIIRPERVAGFVLALSALAALPGCKLLEAASSDPEVQYRARRFAESAVDVATGGGIRPMVEGGAGFVALVFAVLGARKRAQRDAEKIAARIAAEAKAQVHAERDAARRLRNEVTGDTLARPNRPERVADWQEAS